MIYYGSQDVMCPFYIEETEKNIKCENVFSCSCIMGFKNRREKQGYKERYCNKFNFKNCTQFICVMTKYTPEAGNG